MADPSRQCYGALIFDEEEEYDEYIAEATALLAADPTNHVVLNNRGVAYSEIGRWDDAEQDLRNAYVHEARNETLTLNLANVLAHQGKLDEALVLASDAIRLNPKYPYSYHVRAEVLRQLRRNEEAQLDDATAERLRT